MRALSFALAALALSGPAAFAQTVPAELQGQWAGDGRQRGGSQWYLNIEIGPETGVAFYPDDQCTARWVFTPDSNPFPFPTASGHEEIVTGHERCIDGLGLFLRIGEAGHLVVEWRGEDGIPIAIGLLARG